MYNYNDSKLIILQCLAQGPIRFYCRNRVYTKMQQDSQKMNHDLPSLNNQLTECGGTQSTVKLIIEGHKLREVTDV